MNDLLPILKNRNELSRQKSQNMFVEELFGSENSPIVMYGVDQGDCMVYSPSRSMEENESAKTTAIKNLEKLDIPIEVDKINGIKYAMCTHEYAAEKIIDKSFMKKVGKSLNSDAIVVIIPIKGFMSAVAKGSGEANLLNAAVNHYKNAQTYPISDSLYYLVNGEIEMMGGNNTTNANSDKVELNQVSGQNDTNGKIKFIAKIGHKTEEGLVNLIQNDFQNILMHGMKDAKNFSGKIDFHISPDYNKLTNTLEDRIRQIAKNISERGAVQLMGGLSKEEFKVRFYYGTDKLIAETVVTEPVQMKSSIKEITSNDKSSHMETPQGKEKAWWKFW